MKLISVGIAGLSATFALAAMAQDASPPRSDVAAGAGASHSVQFATVDENKDGRISRAEATSHAALLGGAFVSLDVNADSYLSQSEFGKWNPASRDAGKEGAATAPGRTTPEAATPPASDGARSGAESGSETRSVESESGVSPQSETPAQ